MWIFFLARDNSAHKSCLSQLTESLIFRQILCTKTRHRFLTFFGDQVENLYYFLDLNNPKQERNWLSVPTASNTDGEVAGGVELACDILLRWLRPFAVSEPFLSRGMFVRRGSLLQTIASTLV